MFISTQDKAEKYVIYIRKSTDETGKQEQSTEDQLKYCRELEVQQKLNVVDVIEEKKISEDIWWTS